MNGLIVLACRTFTQQRWFYLLIAKVFLVFTKMISLKAGPVVMVGLSVFAHGSTGRTPQGQKVDSDCLGGLVPPDLFSSGPLGTNIKKQDWNPLEDGEQVVCGIHCRHQLEIPAVWVRWGLGWHGRDRLAVKLLGFPSSGCCGCICIRCLLSKCLLRHVLIHTFHFIGVCKILGAQNFLLLCIFFYTSTESCSWIMLICLYKILMLSCFESFIFFSSL